MKLKTIVPWGRNLSEYVDMFRLTDDELKNSKILGCGDGPASFNAEVTDLGGRVTSIDPTYQFSTEQIANRIDEVALEVMAEVRKKQDDFVWKNIANPDALYDMRMSAMQLFLADFKSGKEEGRYKYEILPKLSFNDVQFDLALSSHFLFLYSEHLDEEFHIKAIDEMLRVAREVRIFPLVTLRGKRYPYLNAIIMALKHKGYQVDIITTEYEFQQNAFEMLKINKL
ncbi:SAM-dependent methyltransferase [Sulfurovum lithotrophicum]|nr:SAM-dependent methyltransferase [Sulfurovum lithotrophicum]